MDIIYGFAAWYKTVFDKFFTLIGFNAETTEGIAIIVIGIIVLRFGGDFFARLAEKNRQE